MACRSKKDIFEPPINFRDFEDYFDFGVELHMFGSDIFLLRLYCNMIWPMVQVYLKEKINKFPHHILSAQIWREYGRLPINAMVLLGLSTDAFPSTFEGFLWNAISWVISIFSHPADLLENLGDNSIRKNFDYEVLVIRCLSKKQFRVFLMLLTEFLHGFPVAWVKANFRHSHLIDDFSPPLLICFTNTPASTISVFHLFTNGVLPCFPAAVMFHVRL